MSSVQSISSASSATHQPRLLPKEPGQNHAATAGPSSPGQTEQTFPKAASLSGRVHCQTDGVGKPKLKRDPERNRINQRRYQQRKSASFDGMEEVRAYHRQRYYIRMNQMKAEGTYRAFVTKKSEEGMRHYHAMSEEQCAALRAKNLKLQKAWKQKMLDEGTYAEYRRRLNVRRKELEAKKKQALGSEGWQALQKQRYAKRVASLTRQRWEWLDDHLARPFPLPWLPLDWADSEPEEEQDKVQSIRNHALEKMDQYL